jgi:hypothetical protein
MSQSPAIHDYISMPLFSAVSNEFCSRHEGGLKRSATYLVAFQRLTNTICFFIQRSGNFKADELAPTSALLYYALLWHLLKRATRGRDLRKCLRIALMSSTGDVSFYMIGLPQAITSISSRWKYRIGWSDIPIEGPCHSSQSVTHHEAHYW